MSDLVAILVAILVAGFLLSAGLLIFTIWMIVCLLAFVSRVGYEIGGERGAIVAGLLGYAAVIGGIVYAVWYTS